MCVKYIYKVVFAIVLCKYISFSSKKEVSQAVFCLAPEQRAAKTARLTSLSVYCRCTIIGAHPTMPCTPSVPRMAEATATMIFSIVLQFIFVILLILSYYVIVFVC